MVAAPADASSSPDAGPTRRLLALVAGSGMTALGDRFRCRQAVRFDEIEGVGACAVGGHVGEVRFCTGTKREFVLVLGRRHVYEDGGRGAAALVRYLASRGVRELISLSTGGGLHGGLPAGRIVVARGLLDLQYRSRIARRETTPPAADAPAGACGVLGPAGAHGAAAVRPALSRSLSARLESAALSCGVPLTRGTVACLTGPTYESPAEIRALQAMGADVATMSSAPELCYAAGYGVEVAVIAVVTNNATGVTGGCFGVDVRAGQTGHNRVLAVARSTCPALGDILEKLLEIA